ncbi:hypothetical protein [Microbulbifer spongiae]|uniref:Uncharacterized protein n=1 Tax=Microbulbifer spongiae TaxID=2944933 RepID=A0ABY9EH53_9GAMM|nr:hypothetical protein [Microbulbifer sp. MI-G]WKD51109.1 hypothetical protein M8T91_06710 [Microbulbifer sp. MI-G]
MKENKKKLLAALAAAIVIYGLYIVITGKDFNFLIVIPLINIFLIVTLIRGSGPKKVSDPVGYVKFTNGKINFGENNISVIKIKKIALEAVENECYFSLPYNQTAPGKCPIFVFPLEKLTDFKKHLLTGLGEVEIIT